MILRSTNIGKALKYKQRGFLLNPHRFSVAGSGDTHYNSVSLLLHCDGANGSTTFTDNSPTPKTMTASNGAAISTAQSVFGGASGLTDGVDDFVSTPAHASFDMGSGDFTAEGRVRFSTVSTATRWMIGQGDGDNVNGGAFYIGLISGKLRANSLNSTSQIAVIPALADAAANTWYAWAYTRQVDTFRFFIDGVLQGSSTVSTGLSVNASTFQLSIGKLGTMSSGLTDGYQDEIRITKGVCRYTADYTIATAPFPDSL